MRAREALSEFSNLAYVSHIGDTEDTTALRLARDGNHVVSGRNKPDGLASFGELAAFYRSLCSGPSY
jgi:hypothetical protein